jgi:hypothetical protein
MARDDMTRDDMTRDDMTRDDMTRDDMARDDMGRGGMAGARRDEDVRARIRALMWEPVYRPVRPT